jgi:hypothetical protein
VARRERTARDFMRATVKGGKEKGSSGKRATEVVCI